MRVLFAPIEIRGNLQTLTQGLRAQGIPATAATLLYEKDRDYMVDVHFGPKAGECRLSWWLRRFTFFLWAVSNFDVFHFFFGQSLLPGGADLPILKALGKTVLMHYHGSDVRDTFGRYGTPIKAGQWASGPKQQRMIARYRRYCHRLLVSTPDLIDLVPEATWIPQVIRTSDYEFAPKVIDRRGHISVAHAIATQKPGRDIYGTSLVEGAVERLHSKGYDITLEVVEGLPHDKAVQIFRAAHLGIGRMRDWGWYGHFEIEMMAMGIPVLTHINEELREKHPVPLLPVDTSSLEEAIERLILDGKLYQELARRGRAYVEETHDISVVPLHLIEMYRKLQA